MQASAAEVRSFDGQGLGSDIYYGRLAVVDRDELKRISHAGFPLEIRVDADRLQQRFDDGCHGLIGIIAAEHGFDRSDAEIVP